MGEYLTAVGEERTGELPFGPTPNSGPMQWLPDEQPLLVLPSDEDRLHELFRAVEAGQANPHHLQLLFRNSADQRGTLGRK